MKKVVLAAVTAVVLIGLVGSAVAVPRLQTYVVDSYYRNYYQSDRWSWITNSTSFDLKVVGYWENSANAAPRYDFMNTYLGISVPSGHAGTMWINGIEITEFSGYNNALPSGLRPNWLMPFRRPEIFGSWSFLNVGVLDNDQRGAMAYDHGTIHSPGWGDEILLHVVVNNFEWAHFDAIGFSPMTRRTYTSERTHDATFYATPEPGTLSLLGVGLLGIIPLVRRSRRK